MIVKFVHCEQIVRITPQQKNTCAMVESAVDRCSLYLPQVWLYGFVGKSLVKVILEIEFPSYRVCRRFQHAHCKTGVKNTSLANRTEI